MPEAPIISAERFPERLGAVQSAIELSAIQIIPPDFRRCDIEVVLPRAS